MARDAAVKASPRLDRSKWVEGARAALIAGGIAAVKVEPLAKALGATTGSFYWHFKDRPALLEALLQDWRDSNTSPFLDAFHAGGGDPHAQLDAIVKVWLEEKEFSPVYDAAIRDWARVAPEVERVVRRVDAQRIGLLKRIFVGLGYDPRRAFIRARITYFHQVGYYTLHIPESKTQRLHYLPLYLEALKGLPPAPPPHRAD